MWNVYLLSWSLVSGFGFLLCSLTTTVSSHPTFAAEANIVSAAQVSEKKYDYIVVGGGTAGLTVADRLTEDLKTTVLVIEHGYFYDPNDLNDDLRWSRNYNITTLPATELGGKRLFIGVGHCVGGSSAINGMALVRATKRDYDIWAELGSPGSTWNWDGLLPYFRRAVDLKDPDPEYAKDFNLTYDRAAAWGDRENPPSRLIGTFSPYLPPLKKVLYDALKRVPGIEIPRDGAAGSHGIIWYPLSIDTANNRSYSRTAHWDGLKRPNYDLIVGMKGEKVVFEGTRATGVQFVPKEGGTSVIAKATKEVILSAGALHSPQILMLSGIGPSKLLKEVGIEVKVDLPGVGANLQDHPSGPSVVYEYGVEPPYPSPPSTGLPLEIYRQQGLIASLNLPIIAPDTYVAIASKYASQNLSDYLPPSTHPDVLAGLIRQQKIYSSEMQRKDVPFLNYITAGPPRNIPVGWYITSRGTVSLNSSNPNGEVVVDLRPLSNPVDIDLTIAYVKFLRTHFSRDFSEWKTREVLPGTNVTTDEQLEALVRKEYNAVAGHHFVGTTAKVPREFGGVVDERLKVYGVEGLRVVDAGIMPVLPGAATQFTVYGIAEKGADLIKGVRS